MFFSLKLKPQMFVLCCHIKCSRHIKHWANWINITRKNHVIMGHVTEPDTFNCRTQLKTQQNFRYQKPSFESTEFTLVLYRRGVPQLNGLLWNLPSAFSSKYLCRVSLYKNLTHFTRAAKLYNTIPRKETVNTDWLQSFSRLEIYYKFKFKQCYVYNFQCFIIHL